MQSNVLTSKQRQLLPLIRTFSNSFNDVDYSEKVEYMEGFQIPDDEIKKSLEKISLINN